MPESFDGLRRAQHRANALVCTAVQLPCAYTLHACRVRRTLAAQRLTGGKEGLAAHAQALQGLHDAGLVGDGEVQQPLGVGLTGRVRERG